MLFFSKAGHGVSSHAGTSDSDSVVELGDGCHAIVGHGVSSHAGTSNSDSVVEPGDGCCAIVGHGVSSCTGMSDLDSAVELGDRHGAKAATLELVGWAAAALSQAQITQNSVVEINIICGSQSGFMSSIPSLLDTPESPTQPGFCHHQTQIDPQDSSFARHSQQYSHFSHQHMRYNPSSGLYKLEINNLQNQLTKTATKHDTIKVAFHSLISVLKLPDDTDPLTFSLTDVITQGSPTLDKHTLKEKHPAIHFWTKVDYDAFTLSPESQGLNRGKAPWLELENGDPLTSQQLSAVQTTLHSAWAELVQCKLAPPTWTKTIPSGAKITSHPLVNGRMLHQAKPL
ncbi:hypothetical protein BKA82DRAFT_4018145 [Pisolithus tinctorius]|nr:hypothetical protein BKA82DRAFT_4018145 [Pisolithus tinctorius]